MSKSHEKAMTGAITASSSVSANLSVNRGLNDIRLAVLGVLVGIALTLGFGVPGPWWVGLLSGVAGFAGASFLIRWGKSRHWLMTFMHWLTGA